jgi:hypothetical protein
MPPINLQNFQEIRPPHVNLVQHEILNAAGRMHMVEGYREHPRGAAGADSFTKGLFLFLKAHAEDPANGHYALNVADALFALGRAAEASRYFHLGESRVRVGSRHLTGVRNRWGTLLDPLPPAPSAPKVAPVIVKSAPPVVSQLVLPAVPREAAPEPASSPEIPAPISEDDWMQYWNVWPGDIRCG